MRIKYISLKPQKVAPQYDYSNSKKYLDTNQLNSYPVHSKYIETVSVEMKRVIGIIHDPLVYENKLDNVAEVDLQAVGTLTVLLTTVPRTNRQVVTEQ